MSGQRRNGSSRKDDVVKAERQRMDNVWTNKRLNDHASLSYEGRSEAATATYSFGCNGPPRSSARPPSPETPITQCCYFPPPAQGRITMGVKKLRLAARKAPNASAVNYFMIDESSSPARVDVLEKMMEETVQYAMLQYYLVAGDTMPKGFVSWLRKGGYKTHKIPNNHCTRGYRGLILVLFSAKVSSTSTSTAKTFQPDRMPCSRVEGQVQGCTALSQAAPTQHMHIQHLDTPQ